MKQIRHKTVFIVGGGSSIKDIDFKELDNEITVSINDAYKYLPNTTAIFWVDDSWISENYDNVMSHPCQLRFTSKFAQHIRLNKDSDPRGIADATILRRTGDFGYDPDVNNVMGNNSGTQALNLVVNMKPKRIILLGYDMNPTGHFHDGKRPAIRPDIYTDLFIPSTRELAKGIKKMNVDVEIINANPYSGLNYFKFDDYKNYLKS